MYAESLDHLDVACTKMHLEFETGLKEYMLERFADHVLVLTNARQDTEIRFNVPPGVDPTAFKDAVYQAFFMYNLCWGCRHPLYHPEA